MHYFWSDVNHDWVVPEIQNGDKICSKFPIYLFCFMLFPVLLPETHTLQTASMIDFEL